MSQSNVTKFAHQKCLDISLSDDCDGAGERGNTRDNCYVHLSLLAHLLQLWLSHVN